MKTKKLKRAVAKDRRREQRDYRRMKRTVAKDIEEESKEIQTKLKHNQLNDSVLKACRIIYLQCSPDNYR